jgi:hypothetical protein
LNSDRKQGEIINRTDGRDRNSTRFEKTSKDRRCVSDKEEFLGDISMASEVFMRQYTGLDKKYLLCTQGMEERTEKKGIGSRQN